MEKEEALDHLKNILKSDEVVINFINDDRDRGSSTDRVDISLGEVTFSVIMESYWETQYNGSSTSSRGGSITINGGSVVFGHGHGGTNKVKNTFYKLNIYMTPFNIREDGMSKMIHLTGFELDTTEYDKIKQSVFNLYPTIKDVEGELRAYIRSSRLDKILKSDTDGD